MTNNIVKYAVGLGVSAIICLGLMQGGLFAQEYGGTLTASTTGEPASLDPLFGNAPSIDSLVLTQIFDTLVRHSPEGPIVPHLAQSYEFNEDGTTLTFHLQPGVSFHDGTPVDAEAVAFNLRRLIAPGFSSIYTGDVQDVDSVDVIDDLTVRVNLKETSAVILSSYAGPAGMIASPTALEALGDDFGIQPVGSGPFKFSDRQAGTSLALVRNEDYWRTSDDAEALPYLDAVDFRWITQNAVKMIELESGNVDLVDDIQTDAYKQVADNPDLTLIDAGGISHWISFNVTKAPFDDLRVRQAIYYGIDREMASTIIAGEYGRIIPTIVHPSEFIFDDSIDVYSYDPAKATELLTEAGYGPSNPLRFKMSMIQREPDSSIAQILQAQLEAIGVQLEIQQLERQAFIDEWRSKQHDAGLARIDLPRGDPHLTFYPFFGRGAAQRTGEGDPVLFDLIEEGRVTVDQQERRDVYVQAQERLLDIAHYVWLFLRESKHASSANVQGLSVSPVKTWYLDEVWLEH